jgi:hypothetical protein
MGVLEILPRERIPVGADCTEIGTLLFGRSHEVFSFEIISLSGSSRAPASPILLTSLCGFPFEKIGAHPGHEPNFQKMRFPAAGPPQDTNQAKPLGSANASRSIRKPSQRTSGTFRFRLATHVSRTPK